MSVTLVGKVLGLKLKPTPKLILTVIADYVDDTIGEAWPSQWAIAQKCGVDRRTVRTWLKKFRDEGTLIPIENGGGGRGKTVYYQLDIENAEEVHGINDQTKIERQRAETRRTRARKRNARNVNPDSKSGLTNPENPDPISENPDSDDHKPGFQSPTNSYERLVNDSPLNPPEGTFDQFQRLIRIHPGGGLGNADKAQEAFERIIAGGTVTGQALIDAAMKYDNQISTQDFKPCSLVRWLEEGRYQACTPIETRSGDRRPKSKTERDAITNIMRDYFSAAGHLGEHFARLRFVDVDGVTARCAVPSTENYNELLEVEDVQAIILAALADARISAQDVIVSVG